MSPADLNGEAQPASPQSPALRLFSAALGALDWLARAAIGLILAALFFIVCSQFLDRYVRPLWGGIPADEYVKVGLIWLTFLGFAVAIRSGSAVRVDIIDNVLSAQARGWIYGCFDIVILGVLGVVVWKGMRLYGIASGQLILGTDMTVAVPVLGMVLGLGLTFLAIIERMFLRFAHRRVT